MHLQMSTDFPAWAVWSRVRPPTSVGWGTGRVPECLDRYQTRTRQVQDSTWLNRISIKPGAVLYLSRTCLCAGYRTACPSQGRQPDSESGPGPNRPLGVLGRRGAARVGGNLGTSPGWAWGRLTWPAWELAGRGAVGSRHAGFGHSLRKAQVYCALTKRHSGLTPLQTILASRIRR